MKINKHLEEIGLTIREKGVEIKKTMVIWDRIFEKKKLYHHN